MDEFTIIIPVYNEAENLPQLEKVLVRYKENSSCQIKVLFVNDGSSDGSEVFLTDVCSRRKDFNLISFTENNGLSAALKAGFDRVQTPILGYIDADLQTQPDDFELLLPHIHTYDLITGMRTDRQDGVIRIVSSRAANKIRHWFTGDGIKDTGCPLKIIRTEAAKKIPMFKGMHRFLPAMVLLQGGKVMQVPIRHFPRKKGKGKYGFSNRLWQPLTACFAYLWIKRNYIRYQIKE